MSTGADVNKTNPSPDLKAPESPFRAEAKSRLALTLEASLRCSSLQWASVLWPPLPGLFQLPAYWPSDLVDVV